MIKIKIDENLGLRGKEIFKTNGFDICSVIDEDLCSSSDFNLIKICKEEKRCLVTLDLDFANPLIFKPSNYYGIAVLRPGSKPIPDNLYSCIRVLVKKLKTQEIKGKLWIVQKQLIREYQENE